MISSFENIIGLLFHPLDQFEIYVIFLYWPNIGMPIGLTLITNLTIFCMIITVVIRKGLELGTYSSISNIYTLVFKEMYILVRNVIKNNTSLKRYQYFSTLFFLFLFILAANMIGLIPYSFTITSSFVITFFLALSHFIGINIIAVFENQWKSFKLFLPGGVPLMIVPFLILIEVVSYVAKVFSLSIRLFANMMSGHALLKILIGFSWGLLNAGSIYTIIAILPWIIVTIIMFLEFIIAFLQAYVFTILVTIYINDVLVLH